MCTKLKGKVKQWIKNNSELILFNVLSALIFEFNIVECNFDRTNHFFIVGQPMPSWPEYSYSYQMPNASMSHYPIIYYLKNYVLYKDLYIYYNVLYHNLILNRKW